MLWTDYVTSLGALLAMSQTITAPATATPSTNSDFNNILPRAVEFAELMMYRDPDLDFLAVRTFDTTTAVTANVRDLALPATIIVPFDLNLISPAASAPNSGTRNPVQRVSIEFLNMFYPTTATVTGLPLYYAITDNNQTAAIGLQARLGPTPDGAYVAEWYGQYRPAALSATNTQTFLTVNLPDLFISASMVFMSGYQRNFGAQSDDPKMATSWVAIYAEQKRTAAVDDARRKAQATGWTAYPATPSATPPRM